jgi:hypothetical protein
MGLSKSVKNELSGFFLANPVHSAPEGIIRGKLGLTFYQSLYIRQSMGYPENTDLN